SEREGQLARRRRDGFAVAGEEVSFDQREEVCAHLVGQGLFAAVDGTLIEAVFCFHRPRVCAMG
ncbi:MAG: hypothetical protein ACKOB0_14180, partial [Chthoniobacterales bacterium]